MYVFPEVSLKIYLLSFLLSRCSSTCLMIIHASVFSAENSLNKWQWCVTSIKSSVQLLSDPPSPCSCIHQEKTEGTQCAVNTTLRKLKIFKYLMANINLHLVDKNRHCALCWHQCLVLICCSAFVTLVWCLSMKRNKHPKTWQKVLFWFSLFWVLGSTQGNVNYGLLGVLDRSLKPGLVVWCQLSLAFVFHTREHGRMGSGARTVISGPFRRSPLEWCTFSWNGSACSKLLQGGDCCNLPAESREQ